VGSGVLLVTTFQIAISTGAIVGGVLVDISGSPSAILDTGSAAPLAGLIVVGLDVARPEA
jgi:predicted MFS family arabinose efflux permease